METLHLPETPDKAALDRIERVIAYKTSSSSSTTSTTRSSSCRPT